MGLAPNLANCRQEYTGRTASRVVPSSSIAEPSTRRALPSPSVLAAGCSAATRPGLRLSADMPTVWAASLTCNGGLHPYGDSSLGKPSGVVDITLALCIIVDNRQ
jgi:hypothetical protein